MWGTFCRGKHAAIKASHSLNWKDKFSAENAPIVPTSEEQQTSTPPANGEETEMHPVSTALWEGWELLLLLCPTCPIASALRWDSAHRAPHGAEHCFSQVLMGFLKTCGLLRPKYDSFLQPSKRSSSVFSHNSTKGDKLPFSTYCILQSFFLCPSLKFHSWNVIWKRPFFPRFHPQLSFNWYHKFS